MTRRCFFILGITFAYEALLDEAPKHVTAVVAISGFVEGLFAEAVAVRERRLGLTCHRRHISYPTVHARFSPQDNTRHTHHIITCLCDIGTVGEHVAAVGYLCYTELHAYGAFLVASLTQLTITNRSNNSAHIHKKAFASTPPPPLRRAAFKRLGAGYFWPAHLHEAPSAPCFGVLWKR